MSITAQQDIKNVYYSKPIEKPNHKRMKSANEFTIHESITLLSKHNKLISLQSKNKLANQQITHSAQTNMSPESMTHMYIYHTYMVFTTDLSGI